MKLYEEICSTLAKATTLEEKYIVLLLTSLVVIFIFRILKVLGKKRMVWGDIYMLSVRIIMLPVISLLDGIFSTLGV